MKRAITRTLPLILALLLTGGCFGNIGAGTSTAPFASYGPEIFNIGTSSGDFSFIWLHSGLKVDFDFTVTGAEVYYSVRDPGGNTILTGNCGNKRVLSGQDSFIVPTGGEYKLYFISDESSTPSVITVNYTVSYN